METYRISMILFLWIQNFNQSQFYFLKRVIDAIIFVSFSIKKWIGSINFTIEVVFFLFFSAERFWMRYSKNRCPIWFGINENVYSLVLFFLLFYTLDTLIYPFTKQSYQTRHYIWTQKIKKAFSYALLIFVFMLFK